ncbi:Bug family tripartite tricarboxylate transporter substrate binding protein [Roseomonas sp. BN140053]|uniref:Bug family tripartite tricarboxylate transporter substrate binding protein n=1 Tax=Roseomonas sp. BN140053 TaxID=3391898 RepID=UPI0039EB3DCE
MPSPPAPSASRRALLSGGVALAAGLAAPRLARAQGFPDRPIRLLVPYPPGDGPDVIARSLGEMLQPRLRQPMVIENQPGAGTTLAAQTLKRAAPDGYTLMFGGSTSLAVAPALYPRLAYDPVKDFTLVCTVSTSPFALLVRKDGPQDLAAFVAGAKAKPGSLVYGSAGAGTPHHLLFSILTQAQGIEAVHVPYRGVTPALTDLLAGRIQATFCHLAAALGFLQNGDLRALAVTPATRLPAIPDVPTFKELGFPGMEDAAWLGLVAPAGLPEPVAERLSRETVEVVRSEEGRKRIEALFLFPDPRPYDALRGYVAAEVERWGPIVRASGAEVN